MNWQEEEDKKERKKIERETHCIDIAVGSLFSSLHGISDDRLAELEEHFQNTDPRRSLIVQKIRELREVKD